MYNPKRNQISDPPHAKHSPTKSTNPFFFQSHISHHQNMMSNCYFLQSYIGLCQLLKFVSIITILC